LGQVANARQRGCEGRKRSIKRKKNLGRLGGKELTFNLGGGGKKFEVNNHRKGEE